LYNIALKQLPYNQSTNKSSQFNHPPLDRLLHLLPIKLKQIAILIKDIGACIPKLQVAGLIDFAPQWHFPFASLDDVDEPLEFVAFRGLEDLLFGALLFGEVLEGGVVAVRGFGFRVGVVEVGFMGEGRMVGVWVGHGERVGRTVGVVGVVVRIDVVGADVHLWVAFLVEEHVLVVLFHR
jgi:hypothetical protein